MGTGRAMEMDGMQLNTPAYQASVQKKKGIPGSTVKIIAVVTMLIDHIAAAIFMRMLIVRGIFSLSGSFEETARWLAENGMLYLGMMAMRMVGRLGFPIFCFLLVEGFQKTRNLKKYIFRLGLFALISEIFFDLAFSGQVLEFGYQNVYFTLLFGILALTAFDVLSKQDFGKGLRAALTVAGILLVPLYCTVKACGQLGAWFYAAKIEVLFCVICGVFLAGMLLFYVIYRRLRGSDKAWRVCADLAALVLLMAAADLLRTDYGGMGVITIAAMYLFRKNKVLSMTAGCVALNAMCFLELNFSEIAAFLAIIPVVLYNGERGLKMKYFFYAFYPVHLLIIWLIAAAMGMGWISAI